MPHREPDLSTALESVLDRYGKTVRRLARERGLLEHEVEEVLQEVRIRLWKALGDRQRVEDVRAAYIHRTAMSAALDLIRRGRSKEVSLDGPGGNPPGARPSAGEGTSGSIPGPESALQDARLRAAMGGALASLPERRRVPVRMHLLGYGTLEIAEILGWTEPTARNLIYRGMADLREELLRRGVSPPGTGRSAG